MDLNKALDKVMALPAKEAAEYAKNYVAQLRETDNVAMPTAPDAVRSAVFDQVRRLPSDPKNELEDESLEDAGLHEDRTGDAASVNDDCGAE